MAAMIPKCISEWEPWKGAMLTILKETPGTWLLQEATRKEIQVLGRADAIDLKQEPLLSLDR